MNNLTEKSKDKQKAVVLPVEELTNEAFSPYGSVLDHQKLKPKMNEEVFTFWDSLAKMDISGKTEIGFLEVISREPEFSEFERHTQTEETFFALEGEVIALVAAPSPRQDLPDVGTAKAFRLEAGKGICMREGTWHWLPYPLQESARLLVIFREGTPDDDLEIKDLAKAESIRFRIDI